MKKTEKKMKKTNEAEFKSFDKLDLSKIKGSVSEILTTNFEKFNDCKTAEDVINLCHELFDEAGLKTEWTNKFFYQLDQIVKNNLNPRRAYQQALLYVNNARMKGAGLGMDRGKRIGRLYEGDGEVDESTVCNAKDNKTKKNYTKKQITEAIKYWQKQLKKMDESVSFANKYNHAKYDDQYDDSPYGPSLTWGEFKEIGDKALSDDDLVDNIAVIAGNKDVAYGESVAYVDIDKGAGNTLVFSVAGY